MSIIIHVAVIISRAVMIFVSHEMRFITYYVNICIIKLDENVLIVLFENNVTYYTINSECIIFVNYNLPFNCYTRLIITKNMCLLI